MCTKGCGSLQSMLDGSNKNNWFTFADKMNQVLFCGAGISVLPSAPPFDNFMQLNTEYLCLLP